MRNKNGCWSAQGLVTLLLLATSTIACGGEPGSPVEDTQRDIEAPVVPPKTATAVSESAAQWCQTPSTSASDFVELDKQKFISLVADYGVGWMAPLHDVLLGIDEQRLLDALVETVEASYETRCRSNAKWGKLPPNDALLDTDNQEDFRAEIVQLLTDAVEMESGERLRLSFHECTTCGETVGEKPVGLTAKLTSEGLLLIEVELEEGVEWTRTVYLTPRALAVQANLEPVQKWGTRATRATREGETRLPDVKGQVTAVATKDDKGHMSLTVGLSDFSLAHDANGKDEVTVGSPSRCIGFQVAMGPPEEGSTAALHAGEIEVSAQGGSHCPEFSSCGEAERNGVFDYRLGDVSWMLRQPAAAEDADLTLGMKTASSSSAAVSGAEFARFGLGKRGEGGAVELDVTQQTNGFVVTFEPQLDLGAALTVSAFSEQMRMDLPSWLADEVFDLTFGGDPVASVRVPLRETCPDDGLSQPEVERREVRIENGSGRLAVGGDRTLEAESGQCVGRSLSDSSSFELTSDFWEAGFTCTE